jgi:hypothetical protein
MFRDPDPQAKSTGSLLAVRPVAEGKWEFVSVGELDDGVVRLGGRPDFLFGEPVWLEK